MSEQSPPAGFPWRNVAIACVVLAGLLLLGRAGGDRIPEFAAWVERLGPWGPAVFIVGYAAAVVVFVPASLLTLAAGAIFGLVEGTLYVFVAAVLGSCLAFLVGRHAARTAVARRIAGNPRFAAIDRATGKRGRWIVFLLRLSVAIPFNLLNYALGLTSVRFIDYTAASVGMLPGTVLYVYLGKVAGDVATAASGASMARGPAQTALLVVGLMATVAVTVYITRIARRALAEATADTNTAEP
ncbi:MAG: TVP38/TMEM64 family protein [Myxococcota bacterium]|jgi:uncharacterized membrane protein YdjX (TVP38/TMEM64 family)|nr:hypothetical protein [Deltaproteobacteria bacterium]MCP4241806.1 TVP38/TMEM64 family protein [bacterium]MDP6074155.1 TVP38/TMEM64 family protein [Myxococcota bacterium]MDP6241774.1 TVP38/TMEM64 family protein [Myxococcota bacterium]MDP7074590.1 TVP38/TMEM64 family protein [Myxococcota bacterium]